MKRNRNPPQAAFFSPIGTDALTTAYMTVVFALLAAMSPLGMDSYLPAVVQFAQSMEVTDEQASWTLSNYLIGLGLGQLAGGSLSDQKGRRVVTLAGLILFGVSCVAIASYHNFINALVFRFLQGAGGGLMMVCGMAMIKDTTEPQRLAERLSQAVFVIMIMPAVAPVIGSVVLLFAQWTAIFWLCAVAALLLLVFFYLKVPETNSKATGVGSFRGALNQYIYVLNIKHGGRRIAVRQALINALGSAAILIFVTTAPSILMGHYQLSASQFPLAFGAVIAAMLVGNRIGRYFLNRLPTEHLFLRGMLLYFCLAFAFFVAALFFTFSLQAYILAIMALVAAFTSVGPAGQAMFLNLLDKNFGSATALEQAMRFSLGGVFGGIAALLPLPPMQAVATMLMLAVVISGLSYAGVYYYWNRAVNGT